MELNEYCVTFAREPKPDGTADEVLHQHVFSVSTPAAIAAAMIAATLQGIPLRGCAVKVSVIMELDPAVLEEQSKAADASAQVNQLMRDLGNPKRKAPEDPGYPTAPGTDHPLH